jgi:hypothetical protein
LVATAVGGWDGFSVCFTLAFELGETVVSRITANFRKRWVLEIALPVVGEGVQHGRLLITFGMSTENSLSSVTMVKLLSLR